MKRFMLSILFIVITQLVMSQTLKLTDLEGTWFVNLSNFPMWLKGTKTNPSFNYSVIEKHGKSVLLDKVLYTKKSKTKSIVGYDKSMNANNNSFIWRGKGILSFTKSEWDILYMSPEKDWMIIHFEKTLFTPEGVDVVSKSKILDTELSEEIQLKLTELGISKTLVVIDQQ